jgi:putative hydrolase of the HAD superfamily
VKATAIIFDLGGVILNLEPARTYDAFASIRTSKRRPNEGSLPFFLEFEQGRISEMQFRDELRTLLNVAASDDLLDRSWNAMLLDLPPARLDLLAKLAKSRRIFLLSNTNSIHKRAFEQIIADAGLTSRFISPFETLYYSHEIGMRKPDVEIYQYVLEQNHLRPEETIFVDDMKINIENARLLGIRGIHLAEEYILELSFD